MDGRASREIHRRLKRSNLIEGLPREVLETIMAEPKPPEDDLPLRVVVMVPCLNEAESVSGVVSQIPREMHGIGDVKVIIIDDGSTDGTREVATQAGANLVVRHDLNLGLGKSFQHGLEAALELGADIIVNLDADGQYEAGEIPRLIEPILEGRADIVLGDRQVITLSHMPLARKWGNRIASWATRHLSGLDIRDSQTGFRALTSETAMRLNLGSAYTYTQEMIVQAAFRGLTIAEVPVTFQRRQNGQSRLIRSAWQYALRSGSILLRSYRDHNPMKAFALLSLAFFVAGGLVALRVLLHFVSTGTVSPLLPSAIFAAAMGIVGFQVLFFGLMADTMRTHSSINEEILLRQRRVAWRGARARRRKER